jgi:hypothetical protein
MTRPRVNQFLWNKAFLLTRLSQQIDIQILRNMHNPTPSHIIILLFAIELRSLMGSIVRTLGFHDQRLQRILLILFPRK